MAYGGTGEPEQKNLKQVAQGHCEVATLGHFEILELGVGAGLNPWKAGIHTTQTSHR